MSEPQASSGPQVRVRHEPSTTTEPCMVCTNPTNYKITITPSSDVSANPLLRLFASLSAQICKPLCPECIEDFLKSSRLIGRVIGSIQTNTRTPPQG